VPSKLRIWANRDDGRYFRVGNENLSWTTVLGVLALIAAVLLRGLVLDMGISAAWAYIPATIGALLLLWSAWRDHRNGV
jgi:hypothetical protein